MANKSAFGENVNGYEIPVLNEREIRAAAGILFLAVFISLVMIIANQNFIPIKYVITTFLIDFLIRVFISPRFSPTLIIGRLIVRNQTPEYVGAPQKKFAWIIGIVLATTMFSLMVVANTYSIITGLICLICLIFLFFESAFGICLGCKVYPWFNKGKVQYCPGEVCDIKSRHEIQKVNTKQILIILVFAAGITIFGLIFSHYISITPHDLFGGNPPPKP
jgi:hypothetical protein